MSSMLDISQGRAHPSRQARLRRTRLKADALRIPWGPVWAVMGIVFSLLLLSQMDVREGLLMFVTAAIAAANWWWAQRKQAQMSGVP